MCDPLMAESQEMVHDEVDPGSVIIGYRIPLPGTIMTTEDNHGYVFGKLSKPISRHVG